MQIDSNNNKNSSSSSSSWNKLRKTCSNEYKCFFFLFFCLLFSPFWRCDFFLFFFICCPACFLPPPFNFIHATRCGFRCSFSEIAMQRFYKPWLVSDFLFRRSSYAAKYEKSVNILQNFTMKVRQTKHFVWYLNYEATHGRM